MGHGTLRAKGGNDEAQAPHKPKNPGPPQARTPFVLGLHDTFRSAVKSLLSRVCTSGQILKSTPSNSEATSRRRDPQRQRQDCCRDGNAPLHRLVRGQDPRKPSKEGGSSGGDSSFKVACTEDAEPKGHHQEDWDWSQNKRGPTQQRRQTRGTPGEPVRGLRVAGGSRRTPPTRRKHSPPDRLQWLRALRQASASTGRSLDSNSM